MKYLYVALLLFAAGACKKSKPSDSEIVNRFVKEVKADRYRSTVLPNFNVDHIDALFQHAKDAQLLRNYPWPEILAHYPGEKEVGLVMLYAIEFTRNTKKYGMTGAVVVDTEARDRKVPFDEVLALYQAWWTKHKGKSAEQLAQINPLEGTGLAWMGAEMTQ